MPADALEQYLRDLRDIHSSGAGVIETSYYGRLENLLNVVGAGLKPKVKAIIHLEPVWNRCERHSRTLT